MKSRWTKLMYTQSDWTLIRLLRDIRTVIEDLNPILRGWGNCFRTGSAADEFTQDLHVAWQLRRLMIKRYGRNLHAEQAEQWMRHWFEGLGSVPAQWHHPIPEGGVTHAKKIIGKRYAGNPHEGLKGGWGNGLGRATAPPTTNDGRRRV